MKVIAAGKAKNGFGLLIDTARAEPVTIQKHGRAVAVVLSVEEYERLRSLERGTHAAVMPNEAGDELKRVS
jgi:prevent-host-death family protein